MKEMMLVASDQSETRTELVAAEAHFTKETVIPGQCGTLIYLLRQSNLMCNSATLWSVRVLNSY